MSRMSDLHLTLSCAIQEGEYTFAELAEMYNVPFEWVNNLAVEARSPSPIRTATPSTAAPRTPSRRTLGPPHGL